MGDIYIRGLEMPAKSRGATVEIEDDFIIFVNTVLSPECQKRAVQHEMLHIKRDHFYTDEPVVYDELEVNAAF